MVNRYTFLAGYSIRWYKVERNKKMEAECKSGCEWKLYASWDGQHKSFIVKSCNPNHTCNRADYENLQAKAGWFAQEYLQKFRDNPNWILHGNLYDHYSRLATYLVEFKRSDTDMRYELQTFEREKDGEHVFKRLGELLTAIGRDENNQMFPVAWGVVEAENNDSWSWFLETLKHDMPEFGGEDCTIILDQYKVIARTAVKLWFPVVEHRLCARHIYPPWHKKHGGDELKSLFWKAVYAYTKADYDKALDEMNTISAAAIEDFKKTKS
ncbi:uncharacterized protein LOC110721760 [Chenopodium quinoa]|uniref:uncharacterized protein LOC110721760 n=1 Tax=Chenopodium quinoa TaxID=63459 RepID=UPI000B781430|nr:uncharacterized protein LOC110721760 [Chenopodium quinoa]